MLIYALYALSDHYGPIPLPCEPVLGLVNGLEAVNTNSILIYALFRPLFRPLSKGYEIKQLCFNLGDLSFSSNLRVPMPYEPVLDREAR